MKILVLGADGMLGHQLMGSLRGRHEVAGSIRNDEPDPWFGREGLREVIHTGVDARNYGSVLRVLDRCKPDALINAIGIVKQRPEAEDPVESIEINALLPHRLRESCMNRGIFMIHMSTDCVFSGAAGNYLESDRADANDLYGRSKLLGEVLGNGVVTLRTSIVGLELSRSTSLIEWFLAQTGAIRGYRRAIFTGLTTMELGRAIERVLLTAPAANGIYHVGSEPIDKHRLLCMLRERLNMDVDIRPDDDFACDRSLVSTKFRQQFGYSPPAWGKMLDDLAGQIQARAPTTMS